MTDKFPTISCRPPFVMVVNFGKDSDVKLVAKFSADLDLTVTNSFRRSSLETWITIQYSVDSSAVRRGVQVILVATVIVGFVPPASNAHGSEAFMEARRNFGTSKCEREQRDRSLLTRHPDVMC
jgi:hypothetical protein